jgi:D-amino-acid oxidase
MADVVVVGAGVIGLVTALALEEAGHAVRVVARDKGAGTTSWAAGAIWYPYRADPPGAVARWAGVTREWLEMLAREHPEAGVDILELTEAADSAERPYWAAAARDLRVAVNPTPVELPHCFALSSPRVEPELFLAWLEGRLSRAIEIRAVGSLDELEADVVVNCTGLGARSLVGDERVVAVFGQTVITEPGAIDLQKSFGDNRGQRDVFYSIPRRGHVVLGGIAEPCAADRPPTADAGVAAAILSRAEGYGFVPGAVVRHSAGLRPYRSEVRVEMEAGRSARGARVIHNYGHGGAGYTLCRGCAEDVVGLVRG